MMAWEKLQVSTIVGEASPTRTQPRSLENEPLDIVPKKYIIS